MGVTIHYRGTLRKPNLIEAFEDRIVELAVELGGYARIWRSAIGQNEPPRKRGRKDGPAAVPRIVRGVLLDLSPGLEPISLLVSPEGHLVPLSEIRAAERGPLAERPWVFVKTQYGSVEGHVMLVELLDGLRKKYLSDLEVVDEGGYWETRDLAGLRKRRGDLAMAAGALAEALKDETMSPEAREDPAIVAGRVERVTERVRRILARPPEHAPVLLTEDPADPGNLDSYGTEAEWDEAYKENLRKQAGLIRAIEERRLHGDDVEHAFERALRDEGITDLPEIGPEHGGPPDDDLSDFDFDEDPDDGESWKDGPEPAGDGPPGAGRPAESRSARRRRNPLMQRMEALTMRVLKLPERSADVGGFLEPLVQGILEMSGAAAQITSEPDEEPERCRGILLTQLKRALRGAAFARGSLVPARAHQLIGEEDFRYFRDEVAAIERELYAALQKARGTR